ncbi:MAG: RNA methyltransferase [Caldilineales bacterium]
MIDLPVITSRQNPRIVAARQLVTRKGREAQGCFLVEGVKLLGSALQAAARPRTAFVCHELLTPLAAALVQPLAAAGAEIVPVSAAVMAALTEREAAEGLVATFELFETPLARFAPRHGRLVLLLDRLQDPGNLGTLLRTADAVAAAGVLLLEPCVDPFDPKTVRGSMGSLFHLPIVRTADLPAALAHLRGHGYTLLGADAHRGNDWGAGLWQGRVALALGNEARGLSADVAAATDAWVRLPIPGQAESLNVAVAGGVLLYTWLRALSAA